MTEFRISRVFSQGDRMHDPTQSRLMSRILQALEVAERKARPSMATMFEDVYKIMPPHLQEQRDHLLTHLQHHPEQADDNS